MSDLPPYVERASKQTFSPPYEASGARIYGFILGTDYRPLQEICDRALNRPSGGAVDYRPAVPLVFLTFADIRALSSIDPPDSHVGFVPERDVAFWLLTLSVKKSAGIEVAESLAFYQPYLFVDSPQALLTGREVGLPKGVRDRRHDARGRQSGPDERPHARVPEVRSEDRDPGAGAPPREPGPRLGRHG
jgi:hypothetical protein